MLGHPQQNHIVYQGGLGPWVVVLCSLICLRRTHHIKPGNDRYTCFHCYRGLNTYLWQNNWDPWQSKLQVQKQWLENNNICGQFFRSDKRMQITSRLTVQLSPYSQTICSIYAIRLMQSILGAQALMVISLLQIFMLWLSTSCKSMKRESSCKVHSNCSFVLFKHGFLAFLQNKNLQSIFTSRFQSFVPKSIISNLWLHFGTCIGWSSKKTVGKDNYFIFIPHIIAVNIFVSKNMIFV